MDLINLGKCLTANCRAKDKKEFINKKYINSGLWELAFLLLERDDTGNKGKLTGEQDSRLGDASA